MRKVATNHGFTFIELIVGVSIFMTLIGLTYLNFSTLPSRFTLQTTYLNLLNDLKSQQTEAMIGESAYGIYFEEKSYTLFKGSVYNAISSENFKVTFENSNLSIQENFFPSQVVVFQSASGEVLNFDPINNSVNLTDTLTGESKALTLNKYGTPI